MSPASMPPVLPVSYATASAAAAAALVARHYDLGAPAACQLLARGFNDVYAVRAGAARLVLRISGHRARGPADVAAETAFLAHLDRQGVPVATAIPTREGALFTCAPMPDGPRAAVLFRDAGGRIPGLDCIADARLQGDTLARLHAASDGWTAARDARYRLDLDHLLHRQVAAVAALGLDADDTARLQDLAARLAGRIGALDAGLSRVRCHGDCHGLNARIAEDGPHAGQAVFFDFDDGGFGYLAYDLAVHLWAQVSFGRRRQAVWHGFHAAYAARRPVAAADARAIPVFVAIRHIWLMGEWAGRTGEWGREVLTAAWLKRELAFLTGWENDQLSASLL